MLKDNDKRNLINVNLFFKGLFFSIFLQVFTARFSSINVPYNPQQPVI